MFPSRERFEFTSPKTCRCNLVGLGRNSLSLSSGAPDAANSPWSPPYEAPSAGDQSGEPDALGKKANPSGLHLFLAN